MKTSHRSAMLLFVAGLAVFGHAQASEGFGQFTRTIAAGGFDEQCFNLQANERASWRFDASAPVEFNLHWHRGNDVHYPIRRSRVRRDTGRFVAPHADDYCLMWENKGARPVELKGEVAKGDGTRGDGNKGDGSGKSAGKGK